MPKTILIVVGHWNIEQITSEGLKPWRSVPALKASTGGTGERDFNWNQILPRLKDLLINAGVQVFLTDSIYHQETYSRDYDCAIVLHDDGGGDENRAMSSAPLRGQDYLNEPAQVQAERLAVIWNQKYPELTGTIFRANRITAGMRENYVFDYIGMNTPVILVEHFNRDSQKGRELRQNPDLVAKADAMAIFEFLGLSSGPTGPSIEELLKKIKELEARIENLGQKLNEQSDLNFKLLSKIYKAKSALT